jgi:hypothetical protein
VHKILELWIQVPRWVKQIILSSFILLFFVYWSILGIKQTIQLFTEFNTFNINQLILCLLVTFILFILLIRRKK